MPKRDSDLLLADMMAAIYKIDRYILNITRESFLRDEKTIDAVVRNLEVIGEAARQLPSDFTARHNQIPWKQVCGLRNRIVHDYFGLDMEIIWQVLTEDLPKLKEQLEALPPE